MALLKPSPSPPPTPAEPARVITASSTLVDLGRGSAWAGWKFGIGDWQAEAWRLYDVVGELRFLAGWIGDSVSQCRLYVADLDQSGEETGEVDDPRILSLASAPLGAGPQREDNLRLLATGLVVGGESWIIAEEGATGKPKNWWVVSGTQIRREGSLISVERPIQYGGRVLTLRDGVDLLIRAWRPHPNAILQSDSPTRAAIPILREIELLTKREFAELESRLVSAGVWFLPEGLDFPRGEGDPEGLSGFMALLERVASTNIRDQSQASAMVPIMTTVPDALLDHLDKFKDPAQFWSPISAEIMELKERAIRRLGAVYETPVEILTGVGDTNHWTAWAVGEEGVKRIRPYLSTIADALTRGFLTPTLNEAGIENPERYAYAFDTAPLAVRPNRSAEALQLSDRYLITDEVAVTASAFGADQMPNEDERLKMLLFRAVASDPSLLTDPGVQQAIGMRISTSASPQPTPTQAIEPVDIETQDMPEGINDGPPTPEAEASSTVLVATACEATVLRALEIAGRRLARIGSRHPYTGISYEAHLTVGPVTDSTARTALTGVWDHVPRLASRLGLDPDALRDHLEMYCVELLTHGIPHQDDLLDATLRTLR
jgi:hypothetical protein